MTCVSDVGGGAHIEKIMKSNYKIQNEKNLFWFSGCVTKKTKCEEHGVCSAIRAKFSRIAIFGRIKKKNFLEYFKFKSFTYY